MVNPSKYFFLCLFIFSMTAGCASKGQSPPPQIPSSSFIENLPKTRRIVVDRTVASIGADYAWGGVSPSTGFDCSGLVVYTHSAAGIVTPRTARDMYANGRKVPPPIQPGDLVFFNVPNKSSSVHVGIFIGRNTFVHAPGRGKRVRQASLTNPYFNRHFIGARSFL